MVDATELVQVISEAEDIAASVGQPLTTAHLLLAFFTVLNRAQVLLHEKGITEDTLLEVLTSAPKESDGLTRELLERAREIAATCSSPEADCLHLLIAMTRLRCSAQDLLASSRIELSGLRNTALSYYTGGRMPRRLQSLTPVPVRPVSRSHSSPTLPIAPRATPPPSLPQLPAEGPFEESAQPQPADKIRPAPPPEPTAPASPEPSAARAQTEIDAKAGPGQGYALDPRQFPWLSGLGRNLTQAAAAGKLDPVIGRSREIDEVIDILGKRRVNNPCLLGEPGVGKTAVVEGVAQTLLGSRSGLADRIVIELDMASVVAGTQLRGSFSEKLNGIKDEVRKANGRVVVFIDEVHTVVGAGSTGDGPQDAANELKSALSRGEFPCIGATTHDEWRRFISQDPALERRFTPVMVAEPSVAETTAILEGVVDRYAAHHGVRYQPDSLSTAAALAARYVSDRFLPDKAIGIVNLAGSRCARAGKKTVDAADVARIVAKLAGIPEERLLMKDSDRLLRLEQDLGQRVIGHGEIVQRVAQVVRRNYAGFGSRRPMGSFLFLGPTGVGKTEMARALAQTLFGSPEALVRVDMSELSEAHGTARLVGAPPGYVGYGDGGQLTEPVRRRPSSVVLLDEVEKAHRDVSLLLLQILDEGRLTDGRGRHIDFSSAVVILTSNLGASAFAKGSGPVGFGAAADSGPTRALEQARSALPAELWNHIDERLVFSPLQRSEICQIADLLLAQSAQRLSSERGIAFTVEAGVVDYLIDHGGYDPSLGARPMRQTIQRLVEGPLAERILGGDVTRGESVRVTCNGEALAFERVRSSPGREPARKHSAGLVS